MKKTEKVLRAEELRSVSLEELEAEQVVELPKRLETQNLNIHINNVRLCNNRCLVDLGGLLGGGFGL